MHVTKYTVSITTDGDGNATAYTSVIPYGLLSQIRYVKTDFADGSTVTVTVEGTGEAVWTESAVNASATRAPRQATHSVTGAAALYAGSGEAVNDKIAIANDRLKFVIANGGATKTGTYHVFVI